MLHQIWWQGADRVPATYRAYAQRLQALNPEYSYMCWDQWSVERLLQSMGERYTRALRSCMYLHQKVDFARYCIVYMFGGISVDMDAKPLKPFGPLVRTVPEDTLGVSEFPMSTVEKTLFSGGHPPSSWLNNATLIARRPKNRACGILVDAVADRLRSSFWVGLPGWMAVAVSTGPLFFMHVFTHQIDPSLVHVIPHRYLEPCSGYHGSCVVPPDAVLYHKHDGTWLPEWYASMQRVYYRCRPHASLVCAMVVVLVLTLRWLC